MKNKIIIIATYVGVINRGAEIFVIELVKQLKEHYDIQVYSLGLDEDIKDQTIQVDMKFPFFLKYHENIYNRCRIYRKICNLTYYLIPTVVEQYYFSKNVYRNYLVDKNDISLILPANGIWGVVFAKKIRNQFKIPYIYTGHGGIGKGEELILKTNPDAYISLTPTAYKWAGNYSANLVLIPNGVDVNSFMRKTKLNKNSLSVICVAAFTSFKRQKLLIDAMEFLNYGTLTLLGSGEQKDELSEYGKTKLGNRFNIGSVLYSEVKSYYEKANVFSLPSLNEPFGIVYTEAMSMNIPIVAPEDDARRYIVGDCGILCNVNDAKEYAKAIEECFRKDFGDRPRKRVEELFSWDVISKQYIELIDKVMVNKKVNNE